MIKLLINADDFGACEEKNHAIDECFRQGFIDRTSIMVNMPGFKQALDLAVSGDYMDKIGLHINLIEGTPLTDDIKSTVFCTEGVFNGKALRIQKNRFFLDRKTSCAVKKEIESQFNAYCDAGLSLKHVDSHEHSHTNWSILRVLLKVYTAYEFHSIRLARNIPPKEISSLKRIYKSVVNRTIKKQNAKYSLQDVRWFGSQDDVTDLIQSNWNSNEIVEMMVHPTTNENECVIDAFNDLNIEQWLEKYDSYIERCSLKG